MSIGTRIKEARIKIGLTQEELASNIGVTKGAIANYENGVSTPKIELLFKLFSALQCDANYLYQDDIPYLDVDLPYNESLVSKYNQLSISEKKIIDEILDALVFKAQNNKTVEK